MPGISRVGPALAELLEAAELDHVEFGVGHVAVVVQEDADFGVALDAGDRVDDDAFGHRKVAWLCGQSAKFELGTFQLGRRRRSRTWASRALMRSAGGGQPGRK